MEQNTTVTESNGGIHGGDLAGSSGHERRSLHEARATDSRRPGYRGNHVIAISAFPDTVVLKVASACDFLLAGERQHMLVLWCLQP